MLAEQKISNCARCSTPSIALACRAGSPPTLLLHRSPPGQRSLADTDNTLQRTRRLRDYLDHGQNIGGGTAILTGRRLFAVVGGTADDHPNNGIILQVWSASRNRGTGDAGSVSPCRKKPPYDDQ